MAERELLFSITVPGHEYRIFTTGEVEGFGESAMIANHFDRLVAKAFQERARHRQPDSPSPGAEQSTALPHDSP